MKPGDLCLTCTGACASRCATKVRDVVAGGASRVAYHGQADDVPGDLARYIDHTLLRPDASAAEIDTLCAEAKEHGFAAVCINPTWVRRAPRTCAARNVAVASVIGFRSAAARSRPRGPPRQIRDGAREIGHGHQHRGAQERDARRGGARTSPAVSDACHESGAATR